MPQFATITSFYTFQGNTKARATNVNSNFSNFRGHLLPIDPNTITCIGDTYDVGSVEYRFNKGWFNYIEYDRPTTTCSVTQYSNTAVTAGSLVTQINSVSVSEIGSYYNKVNVPLTSGVSEVKIGGLTASSIQNNGVWYKRGGMTTAAAKLQVARLYGHASSIYNTIGTYYISGATISLDVIGKGSIVDARYNFGLSITSGVTTGLRYTMRLHVKKSDTAEFTGIQIDHYDVSAISLANTFNSSTVLLNLTAGLYYFYPSVQISTTATTMVVSSYIYARESV